MPRFSAIADERTGDTYRFGLRSNVEFSSVTFLADDHIGLTQNPHFANNILYLLLETPTPRRD